MSRKYTLQGNAILCDGQEIANYNPVTGIVTSPQPLHHKVRAAISNMIEPNPVYEAGEKDTELEEVAIEDDPAPVPHPSLGDKDPAFVSWYRRTHTPEQFARRYPVSRRLPKDSDLLIAPSEPSTRMEAE